MKAFVIEKSQTGVRQRKRETQLAALATLFFTAGFIAPLFGLVFTIVHSALPNDAVFDRAATILLVIAIPLLFIGSHFLDVERKHRQERRRSELFYKEKRPQ